MYDSASGVVTSFRATTRSTSRPTSRNSPSAIRSTSAAAGLGPQDDHSLGADARLTCLVDERRQLPDDVGDALVCDRRHDRAVPAERGQVVGLDRIGLGAHDEARPVEELRAVLAELVQQNPFLLGRRDAVDRREVDHDAHHPRPLDVAQELVSEATALARALDQAGDVGHDEVGVVVELAPRRGSARVS